MVDQDYEQIENMVRRYLLRTRSVANASWDTREDTPQEYKTLSFIVPEDASVNSPMFVYSAEGLGNEIRESVPYPVLRTVDVRKAPQGTQTTVTLYSDVEAYTAYRRLLEQCEELHADHAQYEFYQPVKWLHPVPQYRDGNRYHIHDIVTPMQLWGSELCTFQNKLLAARRRFPNLQLRGLVLVVSADREQRYKAYAIVGDAK